MKNYHIAILVMAFVGLSACEKLFFEPEPGKDPEALFENLWTTFKTDYASFDERGVDWDKQYQVYRPQVNASTSREELLTVFKMLLRTLDDGHVELTTPGSEVFYSNRIVDQRIDDELFSLELVRNNYLQNDYKESGYGLNTYGWIGTIGYWHIEAIGENMLETNNILAHFATADGLIVDMRHNKGGNFTFAFSEMGRLTDRKRSVFRSKTKNGKGPNDYTDWYTWSISPGGAYFNKPIVLITDRYTISAGERMAMALKSLPNVTHMGDTTNGAAATKINKELANGWYYSLVTQKIEFPEGISFEGKGLAPDIYVRNTTGEMDAGQDKTLEAALAIFK